MKKRILVSLVSLGSISLVALIVFQYFLITNTMRFYEETFASTVESVVQSAEQEYKEEEIRELLIAISLEPTDSLFNPDLQSCLPPHGGNMLKRRSSTSIQALTQSLIERYRLQYEDNKQLINRVLAKMMLRDNGESKALKIDFDQLYQNILEGLRQHNITDKFGFKIRSKDGAVLYSNIFSEDIKRTRTITTQVFASPDKKDSLQVEMVFDSRNSYTNQFMRTVMPTIVLSVLLFVLIVFVIYIFFQQKRDAEIKADFMNNMTHELKTPLASISLASQMLSDDSVSKSPERMEKISNVISEETQRLGMLIDKVLQTSIFEFDNSTLNLHEQSVNDIIERVVKNFSLRINQNGGTITAENTAENSFAMIDTLHFTNVLYNLLENSVKYTEKELILNIKSWNDKDKLYISVEDNGIGIKKDDQKRIFDQFFRVSTGNVHNVKGFGLGLAYVRKIVQDHGGRIWVESEPGLGSKFIIEIPYTQ